jgi:hypothetical protein
MCTTLLESLKFVRDMLLQAVVVVGQNLHIRWGSRFVKSYGLQHPVCKFIQHLLLSQPIDPPGGDAFKPIASSGNLPINTAYLYETSDNMKRYADMAQKPETYSVHVSAHLQESYHTLLKRVKRVERPEGCFQRVYDKTCCANLLTGCSSPTVAAPDSFNSRIAQICGLLDASHQVKVGAQNGKLAFSGCWEMGIRQVVDI